VKSYLEAIQDVMSPRRCTWHEVITFGRVITILARISTMSLHTVVTYATIFSTVHIEHSP
jgi:hypothetical protein